MIAWSYWVVTIFEISVALGIVALSGVFTCGCFTLARRLWCGKP